MLLLIQNLDRWLQIIKDYLEKKKIRGIIKLDNSTIIGQFKSEDLRNKASEIAFKEIPEMTRRKYFSNDKYF